MTRWVVLDDRTVTGPITASTLTAWIDAAVDAYLERCPLLQRPGLALSKTTRALPPAERLGEPDEVAVSASVSEVHPDSFTLSVRIRSAHDTAVNAKCVVTLSDSTSGEQLPVTNDIRDELIALEHSAQHFN